MIIMNSFLEQKEKQLATSPGKVMWPFTIFVGIAVENLWITLLNCAEVSDEENQMRGR